MRIPNWLLRLLPMWDYICPHCEREVPKNSHECPHCHERYPMPLRIPPKLYRDRKALEDYVHTHIFPKVSHAHRQYLAQFFTEMFRDAFESGDFSAWSDTNGSPSVQSTTKHHDTYAMLCDADSENAYIDYSDQTTCHMRAYVYFTALPSSTYTSNLFMKMRDVTNSSDLFYAGIRQQAASQYGWVLQSLIPSTSTDFTEDSISVNTWYCLEVKYYSNASGEYVLYVNGTSKVSRTGIDTSSRVSDRAYFGSLGSLEDELYMDCCVVADTYIGEHEVFSDGFESNDFQAWDDTTTNGDATIEVQSSIVRNGTYSSHVSLSSAGDWAHAYKNISGNHLYFGEYVRFTALPATNQSFYLLQIIASGNLIGHVTIYNDGGTYKWGFRYRTNDSFPYVYSTMKTPAVDTWYWVEWEVDLCSSDGTADGNYRLYIDGDLLTDISQEGVDTDYTDISVARMSRFSTTAALTVDAYFDRCMISDAYIGPLELFSDGFESGDFSAWSTTNSPSVVGSPVHHGSYAAEFDADGENAIIDVGNRDELYFRYYWRTDILPSSGAYLSHGAISGSGGGVSLADLWIGNNSGQYFFRHFGYSPIPTANHDYDFVVDTWYCIEIYVHVNTSTEGELSIWINGTPLCSHSELDFSSVTSVSRLRIGLGTTNSTGATQNFDCVIIDDAYIGPEESPILKEVTDSLSLSEAVTASSGSSTWNGGTVTNDIIIEKATPVLQLKNTSGNPELHFNDGENLCKIYGNLSGGKHLRCDSEFVFEQDVNIDANLDVTEDADIGGAITTDDGGVFNGFAVGKSEYGSLSNPYESIQLDSDWNLRINFGTAEKAVLTNAGQLQLPTSGSSGGIVLGDANLYCNNDDAVATDDDFSVGGVLYPTKGVEFSGYAPELTQVKMLNSIYYHTSGGVWAPGIAFPTGPSLPASVDAHEGDFFFYTNNYHLYQYQDGDWVDLGEAANAISDVGTTLPGGGTEGDLFNKYDDGTIYQVIDGSWECIGSNKGGLPLGEDAISFTDKSKYWRYANLGLLLVSDTGHSAVLATDQGFLAKKDITAGGFIGANQGELWLGHGRNNSTDVPKIVMMHADPNYYDPVYDTLYLRKSIGNSCSDSANLDLGDLIVHGDLKVDGILDALLALANFAAGFFTADADGRGKFADGFINEDKLADGSITNIKVANLDASKITTGYLSADRVETGSLDAKIAHIGNAQIDDLNASKINAGFLSADRIDTGSIDAKIASISNAQISSLDANKITTGYLSASRIQTGSLNCDVLGAGHISADRLDTAVVYISNTAMINDLVVTSAKLAETLGINSSELPITVPTVYSYYGEDTMPGYDGSYDGETVSGYQDYYLTLNQFKFSSWAGIKHFLKKVSFEAKQTDLSTNPDPYIWFEYSMDSGSNWTSLDPITVTGASYDEYSSTCDITTDLEEPFWVRIGLRLYYKWIWYDPYQLWNDNGTHLDFKNVTLRERGFKGKRGDI